MRPAEQDVSVTSAVPGVPARVVALARRGARRLPPGARQVITARLQAARERAASEPDTEDEHLRLATHEVFTGLAGDLAPGDPTHRWRSAQTGPEPLRGHLLARAVADASAPHSGLDAGVWRRRYLLARLDAGDDVTALRRRIEHARAEWRERQPQVAAPTAPRAVLDPADVEDLSDSAIADDDALLARAEGLMEAVDNVGAAELLDRAVYAPNQLTDRVILRWALALHRCSRYRRSLAVLALCDDRAAADVAASRTSWVVLDRGPVPRVPATSPAYVHVASYVGSGGNYGDRVLPLAVRRAVTSVSEGRPAFVQVHAHQLFDVGRRELAERCNGVIVGGGGLFLPDTAPNGTSGWQWNVPAEQLRRLDVPLAVVAVGFNLFRGQSFAGRVFEENLVRLVDRADLVGLRNHGSIAQVRSLLPEHLAAKIEYLPCPTTVLADLYPALAQPVPRRRSVLINAAYDRGNLRFGSGYGRFLAQVAQLVRGLRRADVQVGIVSHIEPDEQLATDLRTTHALDLPLHRLDTMPLDRAYDLYREAGVVVGMRGHATMIPFGLRTPVLSLVSHPKMRYFLDDIAHPDWGFEVTTPFARGLLERTLHVLDEPEPYVADIRAAQRGLLAAVQEPLRRFVTA